MKILFIILITIVLVPNYLSATPQTKKVVNSKEKLVNKHRRFLDDLPLVEEVRLEVMDEEKITGNLNLESLMVYDFNSAVEAASNTPVLLNIKSPSDDSSYRDTSEDYEVIDTITYDFESLDKEQTVDGKEIYQKQCRLCHGTDIRFIRKHTAEEWIKAFKNSGERLSKAHDKRNIIKLTNKYFKSSNYKLQLESLRDFVINSTKKQ